MRKAIINTTIVMPDHLIEDGVILIEDDKIVDFGKSSEISIDGVEVIDANGNYTGPGLIDIHLHAGDSVLFRENPALAAKNCLIHGVTDLLPAPVYSRDSAAWLKMIREIRALMESGTAPNIIGLYMEGPYLNVGFGSNRDSAPWGHYISLEKFKDVVDEGYDLAKVWCIDPGRENIDEFVDYVLSKDKNAIFSVAHSAAEPWQIERFIPKGLKLTTHHTNATGTIQRYPECRSACVDEATLYNDKIYAELICDRMGIHVEPYILRLTKKIKGDDRIILISDCSYNNGPIPDPEKYKGAYDIYFDHLGEISGSALTLDKACHNMMVHTGASLCQIFKYASTNPAEMLGLADRGVIRRGNIANLVTVDHKFNVLDVYIHGQKV